MHQKQGDALKSQMKALQAQQHKAALEREEESERQLRQLGSLQASSIAGVQRKSPQTRTNTLTHLLHHQHPHAPDAPQPYAMSGITKPASDNQHPLPPPATCDATAGRASWPRAHPHGSSTELCRALFFFKCRF
jgi:hypothetical protein